MKFIIRFSGHGFPSIVQEPRPNTADRTQKILLCFNMFLEGIQNDVRVSYIYSYSCANNQNVALRIKFAVFSCWVYHNASVEQ